MEDVGDTREGPAAQLQRRDGIVEIRRVGAAGNGRDLGLVLGERARIGRAEMLGLDRCEGRHLVRGRPNVEEEDYRKGALLCVVMEGGLST